MKNVTVGYTEPVAYVTKGKHRLKQYNNNTVYLRNGDEFELELFNSTSDKVMAKIELNGNSLGAGIVLRPGERVFIERYLEEARKFMFSTYEVNGKSEEIKRAIANNGDVRVLFYKESIPYSYPINTTWVSTWPTWYGGSTYTSHNTGNSTFGNPSTLTGSIKSSGNLDLDGISSQSVMYSNSLNMSDFKDSPAQACMDFMSQDMSRSIIDTPKSSGRKMSKSVSRSKSVETGRIERGDISEQKFGHDYSTFNTYWTWETKWKILPLSQKPIVSSDIKVFCTNCGTRQKKSSHKFCPNCGTKF